MVFFLGASAGSAGGSSEDINRDCPSDCRIVVAHAEGPSGVVSVYGAGLILAQLSTHPIEVWKVDKEVMANGDGYSDVE
jgi:hypothetical protein